MLQEQQIFAAREVMKVDARPGGYVATGGHGGILGGMGYHGAAVLHYVPALKHTYLVGGELYARLPLVGAGRLRPGGKSMKLSK